MTLQTLAVEYRVSGPLDGTTLAPEFSTDPRADNYLKPDSDNIFVLELDALGLIDPTLLTGQAYADRFIKWISIYGPAVPTGADNVRVVTYNNSGGLVTLQNALTVLAVANGIYSKRCIFVPQGGLLQVRNMAGSPGSPVVIRIGIWQPDTLDALAAMRQACCCRLGGVFENPNPPPLLLDANSVNIGIGQFCARTVDSPLVPATIADGGSGVIVINGSGFEPTDSVVFIDPTSGVILLPAVAYINATSMTATFSPPSFPASSVGTYDILVGPPEVPSCVGTLLQGFTVTP
jgi:hypothetical protein